MININKLKLRFEYLVNDIRQGKLKPSQFNDLAFAASCSLFLQRLGLPEQADANGLSRISYHKTRKIHTDLTPFKKKFETTVRNNFLPDADIPDDLVFQTALRYYYVVEDTKANKVKAQKCGCSAVDTSTVDAKKYITYEGNIDLIEEDKWSYRKDSAIINLAMYNPTAAGWDFYFPVNHTKIRVDYLARPVRPVWNYTIVNGVPEYSAIDSVDLEWDETLMDAIAERMADAYSRNVSDAQGIAYAQSKMDKGE